MTVHLYRGDGDDPFATVVSLNLTRRHLGTSQRAIIAADLATLKDGQRADEVAGTSIEVAARLLNVGRASVERAKIVRDEGEPELVAAVERGEVSVSGAVVRFAEASTLRHPRTTSAASISMRHRPAPCAPCSPPSRSTGRNGSAHAAPAPLCASCGRRFTASSPPTSKIMAVPIRSVGWISCPRRRRRRVPRSSSRTRPSCVPTISCGMRSSWCPAWSCSCGFLSSKAKDARTSSTEVSWRGFWSSAIVSP